MKKEDLALSSTIFYKNITKNNYYVHSTIKKFVYQKLHAKWCWMPNFSNILFSLRSKII